MHGGQNICQGLPRTVYALAPGGLGEDDVAHLQVPSDHNLRRRLAVRLGGNGDHVLVEQRVFALTERTPRLNLDAMTASECRGLRLLVGRVQLDLVDGGYDIRFGQQALQVRLEEVGDTDRARATGLPDLLERLPALDVLVLGGRGPARR